MRAKEGTGEFGSGEFGPVTLQISLCKALSGDELVDKNGPKPAETRRFGRS